MISRVGEDVGKVVYYSDFQEDFGDWVDSELDSFKQNIKIILPLFGVFWHKKPPDFSGGFCRN